MSEANCVEAIRLALSVKLRCLHTFRKWLAHPEVPWSETDVPDGVLESGRGSVFPIHPDWPCRHLVNIDHRGWLECSRSQGPVSAVSEAAVRRADVPSESVSLSNSALIDRYCLEVVKCGAKRARWRPKTESQFRSTMMLWDKLISPRGLADATAQDFTDLSIR